MRTQITEDAVIIDTTAAPSVSTCQRFMAARQQARENTPEGRSELWSRHMNDDGTDLKETGTADVIEKRVLKFKAEGRHMAQIKLSIAVVAKETMELGYGRRVYIKNIFNDAAIALRGYVRLGRCRPEPGEATVKRSEVVTSFVRFIPSHGFVRGRRKAA